MNRPKIHAVQIVLMMVLPVLIQAQTIFTSTATISSEPGNVSAWPVSALKGTIPYGYIRVIDNRTDTTIVGLNSAKFINMSDDNGTSYALQKVADDVYKSFCSKSSDTLVMVINKLMIASNMHYQKGSWNYIEDITDGLRIGTDFYVANGEGYRLVHKFHYFNNPVLDTRKSWAADRGYVKKDISSNWSEYLVTLFDTAFSALIKVNDQVPADSAIATQIFSSLKKRHDTLPINTAVNFKKGVYRNFKEFTDNEPGISLDDDSESTAADSSCWGFCDGQNVYFRNDNTFYQVEHYHGAWYLSSSINALRKKTKQADADHVFGFTFFRVLTHPDEGKHGSNAVTPLVMIRIQNKNIMALQVDEDTGQATF
jgi:hypothetical protein